MDFLIGKSAGVTDPTDAAETPKGQLEARVLAIRPARRRGRKGEQRAERRGKKSRKPDPLGGRVLLLMVPEGAKLPKDLAEGKYRVFLRFKKT